MVTQTVLVAMITVIGARHAVNLEEEYGLPLMQTALVISCFFDALDIYGDFGELAGMDATPCVLHHGSASAAHRHREDPGGSVLCKEHVLLHRCLPVFSLCGP